MKKEIVTCDLCGTIIQGPGDRSIARYRATISASMLQGSGKEKIHRIDVCEDDTPWEMFDNGNLSIIFGGKTTYEGEILDLSEYHVIAVVVDDPARMTTVSYALDDLNSKQHEYVMEAAKKIRELYQQELNNNPHYDEQRK